MSLWPLTLGLRPRADKRWQLALAVWLATLIGAFALDRPIAQWVRDAGLERSLRTAESRRVRETIKVGGHYVTPAIAAMLLGVWHARRWRAGAVVAMAGLIPAVGWLMKWSIGRYRPVTGIEPFRFDPLPNGVPGLFTAENLCFPSGHAWLAFATAAALAGVLPRWRVLFFALAILVGAERVISNAHYLSDVVMSIGLGVIAAQIARALVDRIAILDVRPLTPALSPEYRGEGEGIRQPTSYAGSPPTIQPTPLS